MRHDSLDAPLHREIYLLVDLNRFVLAGGGGGGSVTPQQREDARMHIEYLMRHRAHYSTLI